MDWKIGALFTITNILFLLLGITVTSIYMNNISDSYTLAAPSESFCKEDTSIATMPTENYTETIYEKIERIATNVSNHNYIRGKYDCTQFSKELVKQLKAENITAYCVGTYMKNWEDENKTQLSIKRSLHTWVEVEYNHTIIPIEATGGYIIPADVYLKDYVVTERGVCW